MRVTVAVIVLALLAATLAGLLYLAVCGGIVEWTHSPSSTMTHYFNGPARRSIDVESIPCRSIELVFGRTCIEINVGRWTR